MLPLKVARMMVNLAKTTEKSKLGLPILLDPFCGMGTILQEALLLGFKVIGSDISENVTKKTVANLNWLVTNFHEIKQEDLKIIDSDAAHISEKLPALSVDAIVTEPYLGAPFEIRNDTLFAKDKKVSREQLENMIKGLEKMYLGALKDWQKILKPTAKIVMIMPEIIFQNHVYTVKKIVDSCENLGYTLLQGPYNYARPQAVVKRKIYVFSKK
jgi:tRNA G10  N-methylase Trm11